MSMHDDTHGNEQEMMEKGGTRRMQISLRDGIRAFFDIDDITIAFWGSAWTGREVVTVDDRVVSSKRSLRYATEHEFEHAGIHYRVVFRMESLLRGRLQIELYREGRLVDRDSWRQKAFVGTDPVTGEFSLWRTVLKLAPFFAAGALAGAGAAWLVDYLMGA